MIVKDKITLQAHWFEKCSKFTPEQEKEIYYLIVRYWMYGEEVQVTGDQAVDMAFSFIKDQIDLMNKRMVEKENEFAKGNAGRNKSREKREEKVRELLRENPEYTSKQIAEIIGVSDATIRGYEAWKNRRLNVETTQKTVVTTKHNVDTTVKFDF